MRILLVEDDEILADGLVRFLKQGGFEFENLARGDDADVALTNNSYDAVILDQTLPGMDGTEILRRLRDRQNETPVLVLTARDTIEDRIIGLDIGADDYVTKPFDLREIEARLRALLRRPKLKSSSSAEARIEVDEVNRTVTYCGRSIDLSLRELKLFNILFAKRDQVVTREDIISGYLDAAEDFRQNSLEVYIHRLRKKLNTLELGLKTIRGLGYVLTVPESCSE